MSTKRQAILKEKRKHLKKPGIVIDKSYLHCLSTPDIQQINGNYLLLMGETLLYEISKDEEDRARLIRNIGKYSSHFSYAEHYHNNIEYELRNTKKSPHPSHFFKDRDYSRFNLMATGNFEDVSSLIDERKELIDETVHSVIRLARTLRETYPQAFFGRNEVSATERDKLEQTISNNREFVRSYLLKNANVAPAGKVHALTKIASKATEQWTHYRIAQITLLLAIDVAHRQNLEEPISEAIMENIRHDVLDSQILILATLVGRLATRDGKIKKWWTLLMKKPVDFG